MSRSEDQISKSAEFGEPSFHSQILQKVDMLTYLHDMACNVRSILEFFEHALEYARLIGPPISNHLFLTKSPCPDLGELYAAMLFR